MRLFCVARVLFFAGVAAGSVGCGARTGLDAPFASANPGADVGPTTCVEIPIDTTLGPIEVPLETEAQLQRADVVFLIDVTASMGDEIDQIRAKLRDTLAPAIAATIPDAQIGVATFADFPRAEYGAPQDRVFGLTLPVTRDLSRVQAAMNAVELGNGQDEPEGQVEALYQLSTGEGLGGFVAPSFGCPGGGHGYPCFREDALPIVLLFSDAPFHNGPGGTAPYLSGVISPAPHAYEQARDALRETGIRVIGFNSAASADSRSDLEAVAADTGAVRESGTPLVFDIGERGERLDTGVVSALSDFADSVVFDIDTVLNDPDPDDGVDPRDFVESVEPLRAEPADGMGEIDAEAKAFRGVRAGTKVVFVLRIRRDAVVAGETAQRFRVEVVFRGDSRTFLGRAIVEIVIPGVDGTGCG